MHMYILETSMQKNIARSRTGISKTSNETNGCKKWENEMKTAKKTRK